MSEIQTLCEQYDVWYQRDNDSQRRARLRQSMWPQENGYPAGSRQTKGHDLVWGCRLAMPAAKHELWNYLTPTIRNRVRLELEEQKAVAPAFGKLLSTPRLYDDLLSSQPLSFNLFAELDADRDLAGRVFRALWPERVHTVDQIEFEYSPGRGDSKYLANRSAFDVFVRYRTPAGGPGFLGIEVKYHENLRVKAAELKDRYDDVAERSGVFDDPKHSQLRKRPLQQIWLDHLLALSMLRAGDGWDDGLFVLLTPSKNKRCSDVAADYNQLLIDDENTFEIVALEPVVNAIEAETNDAWIKDFRSRYLDFSAIPEH